MTKNNDIHTYDLAIIGSGMAGMAGAVYANNRNLSTVQIGDTGGFLYSSGLLDLMGVFDQKIWKNPWSAIQELVLKDPGHPYAKMSIEEIKQSIFEIIDFLTAAGLPYTFSPEGNSNVITAAGTEKTTFGVPNSMWNGVLALQGKKPCLIVDIVGMKEFSARQIETVLSDEWPLLHSVSITLSEFELKSEVPGEYLARSLDLKANRKELISLIKPHLEDAEYLGLPAMMGVYNHIEVMQDFESQLGVKVFEIPTMPVSIPGLRIKELYEKELVNGGTRQYLQKKVLKVTENENSSFKLGIGANRIETEVFAKNILLSSGRFLSKGLTADRNSIKETLFNLPIYQPKTRDEWHDPDFFSTNGHLINRAGIETDHSFRPVDQNGNRVNDHLFAAGSILAHQDWKRMKCGAGISFASAYQAINKIAENL